MEEDFKIYKEVIEYNGIQYEVNKRQLDQYKQWYKLWSEGDLDIIRAIRRYVYQEEMKIWLAQKQKEMNGFIAETVKNKKVNNDNDTVEGVF